MTFGFAYDHYDQAVRWHPASHGLGTVDALRAAVSRQWPDAREVATDLDALSSVLRAAAKQGVDFSLVLRLHATENTQVVQTRETRQGSFW